MYVKDCNTPSQLFSLQEHFRQRDSYETGASIDFKTGRSDHTTSGSFRVQTADAGSRGNSGEISLSTGKAEIGDSGSVTVETGPAIDGHGGELSL